MATKTAYATCCMSQVCCSWSPCPLSRPLLTCASARDTQTLRGRSGSVSVGPPSPGVHKVLFEPSKCLQKVWGLIINEILPLLLSCWGFSFALVRGVSFFGGIQHSPVNGCSAASCNLGVLTGEDENIFYSQLLNYFTLEFPFPEDFPILWMEPRSCASRWIL